MNVWESMAAAVAAREGRGGAAPESHRDRAKRFYASFAWRRLRYQILERDGARCAACGAAPPDVVLNIDHIEPLSKAWERRLDPTNLQVLCAACNHGKLNLSDRDWRPKLVVNNDAAA